MKHRSAIIDFLQRIFYNSNVGMAFFYCNYKQQDEQSTQALIGSLVQQLTERHADIPEDLKALYDRRSRNRTIPTPPTKDDYLQELMSQINSCPTTFLVIDALDECEDETRKAFCAELHKLPEKVHFLFTSRDIPELGLQIKPSVRLEIRADKKDVVKYLEDHIKTANRLERHTQDPKVRHLVVDTICEKADGMYVTLYLAR